MSYRISLALLTVLLAATLTARAGSAPDILITVDESNPFAVTFTATSNSPLNSDSSHYFGDGADLTQFFITPVGSSAPISAESSSLTTGSDGTPAYDGVVTDNLSGSYVDINPYNKEDSAAGYAAEPQAEGVIPENFDPGTQAFTGVFTIDLSGYSSALPGAGAIGDIYAGYEGDNTDGFGSSSPVLIGQWEVTSAPVPEPSQWGFLVFLGAVAVAGLRRVRSKLATVSDQP